MMPVFVYAYDAETTHRAVTSEAVNLFNYYYPDLKIADTDKDLVMGGSKEEDYPETRCLNHFYDPVKNAGLVSNFSAKEWATETNYQNGKNGETYFAGGIASVLRDKFGSAEDYSWDRAVYEYAHRDKNRGLLTLGHVIHLLQDMSVPDHTRNDTHLPILDQSSPYEGWTSQFTIDNLKISSDLIKKGQKPVTYSSLGEYFDKVASYSNNNFFSKDTVNDKSYSYPQYDKGNILVENGKSFILNKDSFGNAYKLIEYVKTFNSNTKQYEEEFIFDTETSHEVVADYWKLLSKQAVLHSAGVIKLFFDEVEKEKKTLTLLNENKSWLAKTVGNIVATIASPFSRSGNSPEGNVSANLAGVGILNTNTSSLNPSSTEEGRETEILWLDYQPPPLVKEELRDEGRGGSEEDNNFLPPPPAPPQAGGEEETKRGEGETYTPTPYSPPSGMGEGIPNQTIQIVPIQNPIPIGGGSGFGGGGAPSLAQNSPALNPPPPPPTTEVGTSTATSTPPIPPDTTPPEIILTAEGCGSGSSCFLSTTTLNFFWNSFSSDLSHYAINQNGAISTTTATSTSVAVSDNSKYLFEVSAVDLAGNSSAASAKSVEISLYPIVINEVAWKGTGRQNTNDEWIELYNKTSSEISLDGYVLYATDKIPHVNLSGKIPAKGYFVILRKHGDNPVLGIKDAPVDLWTSFGGNLGNGGENLILARVSGGATTTIDEIPQRNNWGLPVVPEYYSMERIDPDVPGTDITNWGWNTGEFIKNGKNSEDRPVLGTPGKRNYLNYEIKQLGIGVGEVVLTKENSPYVIPRYGYEVPSGKKLKIEAGVVVKFSYYESSLVIKGGGTLEINGTSEDPVIITSFADDEYGGDLNGDGICNLSDASSTSACPSPASWKQIYFSAGGKGIIKNAVIKYGGMWAGWEDLAGASVAGREADLTLENVRIEKSARRGIYLNSSVSSISNSVFAGHNNPLNLSGAMDAVGAYIVMGTTTIRDSRFIDNKTGLMILNARADVSGNGFVGNSESVAYISNGSGMISGNRGSGNKMNGIKIGGKREATDSSGLIVFGKNELPYILETSILVGSSTTLTFEKGTILKGYDAGFYERGGITVEDGGKISFSGNNPDDLIFTSVYDSLPGELQMTASGTPRVGDWGGMKIKKGGSADISGFTMKYGGRCYWHGEWNGALHVLGGESKVSNGIFDGNCGTGLAVKEGAVVSGNNLAFRNHTDKSAINVWGISTTTLENVIFENNKMDGNPTDVWGIGGGTLKCVNCGTPVASPSETLIP